MGRSFHPGCFRCTECNECLDGIPFTVDINEKVYCINDYHRLFAPKCAGCGHIIVPIDGSEETVRVVALDRDYHVDCYHCEKCQVQLTDESDKRCYPIGDHLLCYNCHIDIRSSNLPSPSASSTSSGHSSSSYTLSHGRTSPTPNGHVGRKPPSPLTYPSPLLYNAIPEETADNTYNQSSAQINTQKLPNSVPSYNQAPFDSKSDPNQRLHEKTMHHMAANKDFKLRNSANAALSKKMIGNSLNQSSQSHTVSVPQVQGPELPEARAKFKSIITYTPKLPSTLLGATMTSNLTSVKAASAHKPVPQPPSATGLEERLPIAPRSVPIDHAVPQLNLKRMQGTRRRLPLGDFIMHKKIAESLKKSLNSGAKFSTLASSTKSRSPSPQSDVPAPLAQHSPSTTRTSPTPPLPYYMKAWQASEIAKSASITDFPLAVAQDPVQSQELPPRLVARGQNQPPERPPKLKSIHIAKI